MARFRGIHLVLALAIVFANGLTIDTRDELGHKTSIAADRTIGSVAVVPQVVASRFAGAPVPWTSCAPSTGSQPNCLQLHLLRSTATDISPPLLPLDQSPTGSRPPPSL